MDACYEERDRPLNPYRVPATPALQAIIDDILRQLGNYERLLGKRKRGRNIRSQRHFQKTVTAIICDLVYEFLTNPNGWITLSRSKDLLGRHTPGKPEIFSETLPSILDALASPEMAFIVQKVGVYPFFQTVIRPNRRLVERIASHRISLTDLVIKDTDEVIYLKEPKEDYWDCPKCIAYKDNCIVSRYRDEMREINKWLGEAALQFLSKTTFQSRLVRIFTNGRLNSGGRLFGGDWEILSKDERRRLIRIDGEPVAHVDYGQIMPRLLYYEEDAQAPEGDIYAIRGYEGARDGLKKVMSSMQFASKRLGRFPKEANKQFPKGTTIEDVMKAIEDTHPALRGGFFKAKGHRLQFHESQILVQVLLKLKSCDITALPIHDCVLVAKSKAAEAKAIMKAVFKAYTGQDIPVSIE